MDCWGYEPVIEGIEEDGGGGVTVFFLPFCMHGFAVSFGLASLEYLWMPIAWGLMSLIANLGEHPGLGEDCEASPWRFRSLPEGYGIPFYCRFHIFLSSDSGNAWASLLCRRSFESGISCAVIHRAQTLFQYLLYVDLWLFEATRLLKIPPNRG